MFELDREARAFGVTALENRFITDYLPAAKGDYVKVYLWGLYACLYPQEDLSLESMAKELFLTVPEIEAALRYWERRGLVSRLSQEPPRYAFYSPAQRQMTPAADLGVDMEYVSFAESVYAAFGERRKVNPAEISMAWEWVKDVGLPPETVLMLLQHCISQRGVHFSFKAAEKLAVGMKEAGVTTPDDAESYLQHSQMVHEGVRKVIARMGKRRAATDDETALYEKWITEWQFEPQAVLDACGEMTSGDPSFKYLDGILSGIRARSGARTGAQVKQQLAREKDEMGKAQEVFSRLGVKRLTGPAAARSYETLLEIQPHEVLLLAADECRRTGSNLEDMQNLLTAWKQRGLSNAEEVKNYIRERLEWNASLREIFEACGQSGKPEENDRALYRKWRGWGYDQELILCAAEQAAHADKKMLYLDKVLETWHEAGIMDVSQARARKKTASGEKRRQVSAQQYAQRQYTEEELLAVSDDLIEEARKQRG